MKIFPRLGTTTSSVKISPSNCTESVISESETSDGKLSSDSPIDAKGDIYGGVSPQSFNRGHVQESFINKVTYKDGLSAEERSPDSEEERVMQAKRLSQRNTASRAFVSQDGVHLSDIYTPYLPFNLRRSLAEGNSTLPHLTEVDGAVMILDISGFTKLGEQLKSDFGEREGSAMLAETIDSILSMVTDEVYANGGDVIKFAGDALICLFCGREIFLPNHLQETYQDDIPVLERAEIDAKQCAVSLLRKVENSETNFTMHGGLFSGPTKLIQLGDDEAEESGSASYLIGGEPLHRAGVLLEESKKGEVKFGEAGELLTSETVFDDTDVVAPAVKVPSLIVPSFGISFCSSLTHYRVAVQSSSSMMDLLNSNDIRKVTVMFVSLPEFSAMASSHELWSEENLTKFNEVFKNLTKCIVKYGGACRDFLFEDKGCTFIALFGALQRGERDELAAVSAALAIQASLKGKFSLIQTQIGVSTGEVFCGICGPKTRSDCIVMGSEVNMAARLMSKAKPGTTLVSTNIHRATEECVEFLDKIKVRVKGKEGYLSAYEPVSVMSNSGKHFANVVDGEEREMLAGREAELEQASQFFKRESGGFIALSGHAGIGKTSLERQMTNQAGARSLLFTSASALEHSTSYYAFRDLVSSILCQECNCASISEIDMQGSAFLSLFRDPQDAVIINVIVTELNMVSELQALGLTKQQLYDKLHTAIYNLLSAIPPSVCVFEDAQWLDGQSWSLLNYLNKQLERNIASKENDEFKHLLVIVTRPIDGASFDGVENPVSVTSWLTDEVAKAKEHILFLRLDVLARDAMEAIVKNELVARFGGGVLKEGLNTSTDTFVTLACDKSQGNPLHAKQIVAWAIETSFIHLSDDDSSLVCKKGSDIKFPESIKGAILSRLDSLEGDLMQLLKVASCIGYRFGIDLVSKALDQVEKKFLAYSIGQLVDKGLIMRDEGVVGLSGGGDSFKFCQHVVIHCVNELMMGSQRYVIHKKIVHILKEEGKSELALLAHHYEAGGMEEEAVEHWSNAAKQSLETYNFQTAVTQYKRAISLIKEDTRRKRANSMSLDASQVANEWGSTTLCRLNRELAEVLRRLAMYDEAKPILLSCLDISLTSEDWEEKLLVRSAIGVLLKEKGNYTDAHKYYVEALEIAKKNYDETDVRLAKSMGLYAELLRKQGSTIEALELHQKSLAIQLASPEKDEVSISESQTFLGCCFSAQKEYSRAADLHEQALCLRHECLAPAHPLLAESLNYVGETLRHVGKSEKALPCLIRALDIREKIYGNSHPAVAHVLGNLAAVLSDLGRLHESEIHFLRCIKICEDFFKPDHPNLIPNLVAYGKLLVMRNKLEKSRELFTRAKDIFYASGGQNANVAAEIDLALKKLSIRRIRAEEESSINEIGKDSSSVTRTVNFKQSGSEWGKMLKPGLKAVLITDPGRDLDDEFSFLLMSSFEEDKEVECSLVGVVAVLSPSIDRACLARGSLDLLGMPCVPVVPGAEGGKELEINLDSAKSYCTSREVFEKAVDVDEVKSMDMLVKIYDTSEEKSIQVTVIACMTDLAEFMRCEEELFVEKTKSVCIMGGVVVQGKEGGESTLGPRLVPDSAYNNACDKNASEYVYSKCQDLGVPLIVLTRHAAYACPIEKELYSEMAASGHPMAVRLYKEQKNSILGLWKRAASPLGSPKRKELPDRCDKAWFLSTFTGGDGEECGAEDDIWPYVKHFMMYDPLACLVGIDKFADLFDFTELSVNGCVHKVVGFDKDNHGLKEPSKIKNELVKRFKDAIRLRGGNTLL